MLPPPPQPTPPEKSRTLLRDSRSGMVLLIVLTCLSLLAILVVSFLLASGTELKASKLYSVSAKTQNLAASGMNLAMGQVKAGAKADSNSVSWASQPGMIRNYDASGTNSTAIYKLYSSSQMTVTGPDAAAFSPAAEAPPLDWDAKPARYTDLNAPAEVGGFLSFPIVDPRASAGANAVTGFSYNASVNGAIAATSGTDDNARLPMPVEWLYVLKDGSFVAATSADGKTATVAGASKTNPIVGRVAFWADDESCKVNVNTASEGNFWDIPMATLKDEGPLNAFTPMAGEYQRYPGHPATTSLSVVFPWLKGTTIGAKNDEYLRIAPRIVAGGSREGTEWSTGADALQADSDRLYDSVDELIFAPSRAALGNVTSTDLEARRFFLTAQSKSPETTLFNTPRIAIWPVHRNPSARHASEKLIDFAATTKGANGRPYFFTREDPLDPMKDFNDASRGGRNAEILGYLQTMTSWPIPGFGRSFAQKWTQPERDQILVQIYDYIRSCLNLRTKVLNGVVSSAPGAVSYTRDENGRQGNVYPTALPSGTLLGAGRNLSTDTRGFGRFPVVKEISMVFAAESDPVMGGTSWSNRLPVVDPATQLLIGTPAGPGGVPAEVPARPAKIWPALLVEMFLPSQGLKEWLPNLKVTVSGLSSFSWRVTGPTGIQTSVPMFNSDSKVFNARNGASGRAQVNTGDLGVALLYTDNPPAWTGNPAGPTADNWSPDFLFNGGTVEITVDLAEKDGNVNVASVMPASMLQKLRITFPAMTNRLPNPRMGWQNTFGPGNSVTGVKTYGSMAARQIDHQKPVALTFMDSAGSSFSRAAGFTFEDSGWCPQYPDTVKSMVVRHGDFRLVGASSEALKGGDVSDPNNIFVPHQNYFTGLPAGATVAANPALYQRAWTAEPLAYYNAHTLHANSTVALYMQTLGKFVFGPDLAHSYQGWGGNPADSGPSIAPGILAANSLGRQGDWDNGIGSSGDGAFINKPDEGTDRQTADPDGGLNYLWDSTWETVTPQLERTFGPMRQIASPVMFGSLPTGVKRGRPWETLLFCPNPAASFTLPSPGFTTAQHAGFESPPDHLLLDLFWMPVSEPYAISDPLATAGKINLNYQIMPFTYVKRNTAMRAVLANQKLTAFEEASRAGGTLAYKAAWNVYPGLTQAILGNLTSRHDIDASETLLQFDEIFADGKIFKSPTQICELFLVPAGQTLATTRSPTGFWSTRRLTGDNMRERPYNAIYPRVTTQSNVYTVYVKAQDLKQLPATLGGSTADTFTEGKDIVEGEFQASYTFERYLDPNASLTGSDTAPLGSLYKLRVITQRNLSY